MIAILRRYVFRDFKLKLVSVIAASLLWMAIAHEPISEVSVTVPIEFQHVTTDLEFDTVKIPEAQIWVRGPSAQVRKLAQSEVRAILDLSGARPGEHTYDLTGAEVHVPHGVEVVQIVPAQLHLAFDRRVEKEVPIQVRVAGKNAAAGHHAVSVDPAMALVTGPANQVEDVDSVLTDAVDLSGVTENASFPNVHIYATNPLVRVVRPLSVKVSVTAAPGREQPTRPRPETDSP